MILQVSEQWNPRISAARESVLVYVIIQCRVGGLRAIFSHMLPPRPTLLPSVLPSAGILELAASRGKSKDALHPESTDFGRVPTKMRTSCTSTLGDGWGADSWVGFFHGDWMGVLSLKPVQRVEGGKHLWWPVVRLCSNVLGNWAHLARLVLRMGAWRC